MINVSVVNESSTETPDRSRRSPLSLWVQWTLANAIGGATVGALEGGQFQFFATLVLTGCILGIAQWLVLRREMRQAGGWILASTLGWWLGVNLMIGSSGVLDPIVNWLLSTGALWETLWLNLVKQPINAIALGVAQWWVLRRQFRAASWWVVGSAVAGAVYGSLSAATCAVACQPLSRFGGAILSTAMTYSVGWAGAGAITGLVLVWLRQSHQKVRD